jgi:hypothetical protein
MTSIEEKYKQAIEKILESVILKMYPEIEAFRVVLNMPEHADYKFDVRAIYYFNQRPEIISDLFDKTRNMISMVISRNQFRLSITSKRV